ncbi:MAG: hypothetical protein NXI10_00865 [bacterium]|nr:hypothetical protein [bacterium]
MAEPFGFFENSPLNNFSGTSSGNGEGFPRPPEPPIVSNSMDLRMLFADILDSYEDYNTSSFYFNPKKYHVPWKKQIEIVLNAKGPNERLGVELGQVLSDRAYEMLTGKKSERDKFDFAEQLKLSYATSSTGSIDSVPYYKITLNPDKTYATYTIYYLFQPGTVVEEGDYLISADAKSTFQATEFSAEATTNSDKRIVALEFSTKRYWPFKHLLERYGFDFYASIKSAFQGAYKNLGHGEEFRNLYWQTPREYLKRYPIDFLFTVFWKLMEYDQSMFSEGADGTMNKILEVIASKEGGMKYIYDKFNARPDLLIKIYYALDGESQWDGEQVSNKTILASTMVAICAYHNLGLEDKDRRKRWAEFRIDKNYFVDSNAYFDETKPNRFELTQRKKKKIVTDKFDLVGTALTDGSDTEVIHPYGYFHPLDIVTLHTLDKKGKPVQVDVPAIIVKDMAYHAEWQEISRLLRIGINLLVIVLSAATLFAGAGYFFSALAIMDLGLATGDITVQMLENELRKTAWGREFLDTWERVYTIAGIVTSAALLPTLLESGIKAFMYVTSKEARAQIGKMLQYALKEVDGFPTFTEGVFDLVDKLSYLTYANMSALADRGAIIFKGKLIGESDRTYFLSYRGATILSGKYHDFKKALRAIFNSGDNLTNFLNKQLVLKTGTGGGFKYIDEKVSSRILGQDLEMSCGLACVAQFVRDKGVNITEKAVRKIAKFESDGIDPFTLGPIVQDLLPNGKVYHGSFDYNGLRGVELLEAANSIAEGSWIASFGPSNSRIHTIIVDKIINDIVFLRDPWDTSKAKGYGNEFGVEAQIKVDDFVRLWSSSNHHFIILK